MLPDDGAFAFGSKRDIEVGARILYDNCVMRGMLPHTAGKTVAMYSSQPVVNLRELPDEAILPIEMGDGAAPAAPEFKHLGSLLSQSFEDSVTIMDIIILARIAFTSNGHFRDEAGFTRIREDCLRIAHTLASIVWLRVGMLGH